MTAILETNLRLFFLVCMALSAPLFDQPSPTDAWHSISASSEAGEDW